jgi:peptidyl-prolyl cis-trans isomerase A (cyclophilin A)
MSMRLLPLKLWNRLRKLSMKGVEARRVRSKRLVLEALEDRAVPTVTATGALSGMAFWDPNHTGTLTAQSQILANTTVNLTGKDTGGNAVNLSTTTDTNGVYSFLKLNPGTYQVGIANGQSVSGSGAGTVSNVTVNADAATTENIGSPSLSAQGLSLRMFLASSTAAQMPIQAINRTPTVLAPIVVSTDGTNNVAKSSSPITVDLAANFTGSDLGNTIVELDTNSGGMDMQLFDTTTPQTVANFLDYVEGGDYSNDVFHRLTTTAKDGLAVLQGGGFTLKTNPNQIVSVNTLPPVKNEFKLSNTQGTVAMAKTSDPNSATSQFFINLADNSSSLNNTSNSGGFTVFGKLVDSTDQAVANAMSGFTIKDESSSNSALGSIPLNNYTGTTFPTDATTANFALINKAFVASQSDELNYSVVSNSNPGLVTPSITNERLTLSFAAGQTGTATITIRATNNFGQSIDSSFTLHVN